MARKSASSGLEVVPKNADIGSLGVQYEDFLAVQIECASAITKPEEKALRGLYDGWRSRVDKATRKIAKEDGDELVPTRFDGFGVSGTRAHGGASRFLDAAEACKWLVRELAKRPGVVRVVFGEEDVPAAPKAAAGRPGSAVVKKVDATVAKVFGDDAASARVLGCIAIRFTGDKLGSPGKTLRALIDEAVLLAGDVGSIWVRGTWGKPGSLDEVNQGRDLHDKTGKALLDRIFAEVPRMPASSSDREIVDLVLSDGARPSRRAGIWESGSRVAASFGLQIRLQEPQGRPPGGLLEVYVPLADLDDATRREAWVAFGARAFATLHGTVGSFSPALWMEEITPDSVPLALLTELPAVTLPQMVGSHAGGFSYPDFAPSILHGFFSPPWIAWLSSDLARPVRAYPGKRRTIPGGVELRVEDAAPLAMTEASYARYRAAWKALDALRIRWTETDEDDREAWRHSLASFDAPSFGELRSFLKRRLDEGQERSKLYWTSLHAARNGEGKKAFTEAERAITLGFEGHAIHGTLLEGALSFKGAGKPDAAVVKKALARIEKLPSAERAELALLGAKALLLIAPQDPKKALAWLSTHASSEPRPLRLAIDPVFAPIADDDRFRRAAGWATKSEIAKLGARPTIDKAFPKLARAIKSRPEDAAFGPPASKKDLEAAARALGMKLPPRYRAMLAAFDGAIFQDGREVLYRASELAARNASREKGGIDQLTIGRNLILYPNHIKNGEASLSEPFYGVRSENTTLHWNTLDACLADLARGKK